MGHRIAGPPSLLSVSGLATHLAGACSLEGRVCVCTSTGNRSEWLSSLASQYAPEFRRKFAPAVGASAPCGAQANTRHGDGQQPCWRRPASKPGQSCVRIEAQTPSPLGGNLLSTPGASEYLGNAPAWALSADGKRARHHDLVTSELNVLNNPSNNLKRKQHLVSTRTVAAGDVDNAEMSSVAPVTRQSGTTAHDAFRCVGQNPTSPVGRRPCHAGPSACMSPGRRVVRRRRERSRRAAGPVWNDLLSGVPRHPTS